VMEKMHKGGCYGLMLLIGRARKWLNWWNGHHQQVSWSKFLCAFFWRFELGYRSILPNYEEEPAMESGLLTVKSSCNMQQGKQVIMEKVEEGKNSVRT